jgi:hypothetical protein
VPPSAGPQAAAQPALQGGPQGPWAALPSDPSSSSFLSSGPSGASLSLYPASGHLPGGMEGHTPRIGAGDIAASQGAGLATPLRCPAPPPCPCPPALARSPEPGSAARCSAPAHVPTPPLPLASQAT